MTRTLVWTGFMTVDGKVDSPGSDAEGHRFGGWVRDTEFVEEAYSLKGEELAETSALMFGKRSYQAFAPFWSRSADHAAYQDLDKYVVSSSLTEHDLIDTWGAITILRSTQDVATLKEQDGGAIFIHGSADLARRLSEAGLIDRYHLLVFPYLLGAGKSPFPTGDVARQSLQLTASESYRNGVVKLVYQVHR